MVIFKWCIITDITAMCGRVGGKNKIRMNGYPPSWNQMNLQKEYRKNWARLTQKIYPVEFSLAQTRLPSGGQA